MNPVSGTPFVAGLGDLLVELLVGMGVIFLLSILLRIPRRRR